MPKINVNNLFAVSITSGIIISLIVIIKASSHLGDLGRPLNLDVGQDAVVVQMQKKLLKLSKTGQLVNELNLPSVRLKGTVSHLQILSDNEEILVGMAYPFGIFRCNFAEQTCQPTTNIKRV